MPGEERLREHVVEAAEAARSALRELVQSTTTPVSVERVIEIESAGHLALGEAGQAARILAREREGGG